MDTERLKPYNEFNSEKSAMVNEICYRLFNEQNNNFFKELKKISIPTEIQADAQIDITIGPKWKYENTGFIPILFETGDRALAFGKYSDGTGTKIVIKNTSPAVVATHGTLYLLIMEVK